MKKNLLILSISVTLIGVSLIVGAIIGSSQMYAHTQSLKSLYAIHGLDYSEIDIDSKAEFKEFIDSTNRSDLRKSILEYGKYLDRWDSKLPILISLDDSTRSFFKQTIRFYLDSHYVEPELSPSEIVDKVITDMRAEGDLKDDDVENTSRTLLNRILEDQSNLKRAREAVGL